MQLDAVPLDRNYPNFVGIRSAITGEKIKVLGPHDAIINEKQAKQIFGDKNPVGASIRLSKSYGNYQLRLVDVYQDLSLTELDMSSSALFYSPCELEDMDSESILCCEFVCGVERGMHATTVESRGERQVETIGAEGKNRKAERSVERRVFKRSDSLFHHLSDWLVDPAGCHHRFSEDADAAVLDAQT